VHYNSVTSLSHTTSTYGLLAVTSRIFFMFLYVQLYDRLLIVMMPVKYQPDYVYLRHVKVRRVHLFTFIQFICFVAMWAVKSIKTTSITFPLMVNSYSPSLAFLFVCLSFASSLI